MDILAEPFIATQLEERGDLPGHQHNHGRAQWRDIAW